SQPHYRNQACRIGWLNSPTIVSIALAMYGADLLGRVPEVLQPRTGVTSFSLVLFIAPSLSQGSLVPMFHGRQGQQQAYVFTRARRKRRIVCLYTQSNGGKEGIDSSKGIAGEERSSEARQAIAPELVNSLYLGQQRTSERLHLHADPAVHRA